MGKSKRDAFEYWERKLKDDASNPRVHRNLAPMYLEQAQLGNPEAYPTAIKHLKAAVHFDPSNDQSRNDFALALLRAGRLDQAIEQFKVSIYKPRYSICQSDLYRLETDWANLRSAEFQFT
jgi:tetratricopeptide (TPR) repeat protein